MIQKLGCLHAHYSNIAYIQNALGADDLELVHYVDPGLMSRLSSDRSYDLDQARKKVSEQIEWIAQTNVDRILITCTNYITLLEVDSLKTTIPVIKIDEPFFEHICSIKEPQLLLFTNPVTVEGTMKRLNEYAENHEKWLNSVEVHVIENTFELIMQGKKAEYEKEVASCIRNQLAINPNKQISVVQLSMVEAAENVEDERNVQIGNPLKTLVAFLN